MRAVLQRVTQAQVVVEGQTVGAIEAGLLVLLGVADGDTDADAAYIVNKIAQVRLFEDADGKMNLSLPEVGGAALVVSQFTLMGDCRKGRRPSWAEAARPEQAILLYESVVAALRTQGIPTETGTFQAHMAVSLTNDGPVTVLLDSRRGF